MSKERNIYEGLSKKDKVRTFLDRNKVASVPQLANLVDSREEYVWKFISRLRHEDGLSIACIGQNTRGNTEYLLESESVWA